MTTFLIIWLGQLISIIGSGLTSFALGVWIYEQTGKAMPFAITVMAGNLTRVLLSPVAGSLADRWNRRKLMVAADTGDALVTLAAVALVWSGQLTVWQVYLIALFSAAFSAFQEPAYTASISMLVPKEHLARASGMMQAGQAIEMLVAPALAGVLFGTIGFRGIVIIDFVTYFFAIGALVVVTIPQPVLSIEDRTPGKGQVWRDMVFGWRYLWERRGLFGLLFYFALANFCLNFAAVLVAPLVLSFSTPTALGLVQTISGAGMLAGSVLLSAWGGPKHRVAGVIGFVALAGLGLIIVGVWPAVAFPATGLSLLLFSVPIASGSSQAIFQTKVAREVQGRVFAVRSMVARSMMPLAFISGGFLADSVFEPLLREGGALAPTLIGRLLGVGAGRGMGLLFILAGIGLLLASLGAYADPHIRRAEVELADAAAP